MTVKFWAILNKRSAIIINEYTPWDSIHFLRYLGLFVFVFNETKHFHTECFWTVGHWRYLRKKFFAHYWQKLSTYYYPNYQVLCEKFKPLTFIQLPKLESSLHSPDFEIQFVKVLWNSTLPLYILNTYWQLVNTDSTGVFEWLVLTIISLAGWMHFPSMATTLLWK